MKNIFIDAGAHDGVLTFEHFIIHQKHLEGCEVHFFEPLSYTYDWLLHRIDNFKKTYSGYTFIPYHKAVWVKNEINNFYEAIGSYGNVGSTLHADKKEPLKLDAPEKVECIDIEDFILKNFDKEDYITLKLDVEGSEYEILNHLLNNNNAIYYINEILIEWHDSFYDNVNPQDLIDRLNEKNIKHNAWLL